jgi:hypothetical protein
MFENNALRNIRQSELNETNLQNHIMSHVVISKVAQHVRRVECSRSGRE